MFRLRIPRASNTVSPTALGHALARRASMDLASLLPARPARFAPHRRQRDKRHKTQCHCHCHGAGGKGSRRLMRCRGRVQHRSVRKGTIADWRVERKNSSSGPVDVHAKLSTLTSIHPWAIQPSKPHGHCSSLSLCPRVCLREPQQRQHEQRIPVAFIPFRTNPKNKTSCCVGVLCCSSSQKADLIPPTEIERKIKSKFQLIRRSTHRQPAQTAVTAVQH
ncbi:hypothetical protein BCR34DRAFT_570667 [Clohesyomyces aquaticus]|uniref:Uncharacterized protein n=1 Tax=Clohesyomyces aquaticus TaxID=1231657 RepID=A0A1Y1ZBA7_9PLEO|nr:hypothetical protein BCR34DRAFT_570667 [Clohesyomyces aquaticus]